MDPNNAIKQALAVAIVRQKRKINKEADEWRSKALRLEQHLAQQQSSNLQLRQWTSSVLQQASAASNAHTTADGAPYCTFDSIFLPPLVLNASYSQDVSSHQADYKALQHQLLLAAEACSIADYAGTAEVLNGKAAALSDMLLTNIQMLQQLTGASGCSQAANGSAQGSPSPAASADTMFGISNFVQQTLLQIPASSLRTAYMRQCAAMIAALLSSTSHAASIHEEQQVPATVHPPAAASSQLQRLATDTTAGQTEGLAVHAVQLMQQLLQHKLCIGDGSAEQQQHAEALSAAATVMLQQLSTFPSTALLMLLAVAQQLQRHVQQLQQAKAAAAAVRIGRLSNDVLQMASHAAEVASQVFEASHELLEELDEALVQLPTWGLALADCQWTPRAIEDLVSVAAMMYSSCQELQQYQPLLATAICHLAASLATTLQHVATNSDAPGMREGSGASLRSVCGRLCLNLRDLFMP